jgi:hypothetical protein
MRCWRIRIRTVLGRGAMVEPLTNAVLLVGQSRQVRAFHELPNTAHAIAE